MSEWPPQLWAALVAFAGTIAGIIGRHTNSRADAAATLTDGALRVVQELQEEVTRLRSDAEKDARRWEKRMAKLEAAQREERSWCDMRIGQLVAALSAEGIDVPPPPPRDQFSEGRNGG